MATNYHIYNNIFNTLKITMLHKHKQDFMQNSKRKLQFLNYSNNTIKIYLSYINLFLSKLDKPSSKINSKDFEVFLNDFNFSSISQQNQILSSLKFFYEKILNKKYKKIDFQRPRKEKRLPRIIDFNTASLNIRRIKNLKHKTILSIPLSTGIRVSELLNLKITDIDSKRMVINVRNGKGKKQRFVPLSENLLKLLREYYKVYKPKELLFEGQNGNKYSPTSVNKVCKKFLGKNTHIHLLRHTYLTFLAENNVNLEIIKEIAGHQKSSTTSIYLHLTTKSFKDLPSINIF